MRAIDNEAAAATAEGVEAPQTTGRKATPGRARKARDNGEAETNSSPARKRRPTPYTRSFRAFLEQLGEDPREFDRKRRKTWEAFNPEDGFEEDLVEDIVENRWELGRLKRTRQAKLVEIRRRTELKRQQRLASESRAVDGMAEEWLKTQEGFTALPDSQFKFERTILYLRGLRATVQLEGFTELGPKYLRVVFGEHPGLSASELVMAYNAGMKKEAQGDEEAKEAARRTFLHALEAEIAAYQKLEALYREGAVEIPEATRDAQMMLDEKDLTNLLRQERMLELQYQLKLEQWSAWRMAKQGTAEVSPQGGKGTGVPNFRAARGGGAGQLAVGRGSVGRPKEGPLSMGGLSL